MTLLARSTGVFLALSLGCASPIGTNEVDERPQGGILKQNVLADGTLSSTTEQVLLRYDLAGEARSDPRHAIEVLHRAACADPDARTFFALAELSHRLASRTLRPDEHFATAVYAWFVLFGDGVRYRPSSFDRHFALAGELYNLSLREAVAREPGEPVVLRDGVFSLAVGSLGVSAERARLPENLGDYTGYYLADDFRVRGLDFLVRDAGLGVPLVADADSTAAADPALASAKPAMDAPATLLLHVDGGLAELAQGTLGATLELYYTPEVSEVAIGERTVPLEIDLTTPLAHSLQDSLLWSFELKAFFRPGMGYLREGMHMVYPFQSGKIPVVFVHGTYSSPARWAATFNGLHTDGRLRDAFQFWFFLYDSGNPVWYSATKLRESLTQVLAQRDPDGRDAALRRVVLVGHSQGGLLVRMAVPDGKPYWDALLAHDLDEDSLDEDARAFVHEHFDYEALPSVERVVFVATPHRGSFIADDWLARLVSRHIAPRGELRRFREELLGRGAIDLPPDVRESLPTSVDNMDPNSFFQQILAEAPIAPRVHAHSIIPVKNLADFTQSDDGVVTYASAHLDGAESELLLHSHHSCQADPLTIGELRRILLEHLGDAPAPPVN